MNALLIFLDVVIVVGVLTMLGHIGLGIFDIRNEWLMHKRQRQVELNQPPKPPLTEADYTRFAERIAQRRANGWQGVDVHDDQGRVVGFHGGYPRRKKARS